MKVSNSILGAGEADGAGEDCCAIAVVLRTAASKIKTRKRMVMERSCNIGVATSSSGQARREKGSTVNGSKK